MQSKLFLRGSIFGFILPSLVFLLCSFFEFKGDFIAFYYQLEALHVHTHVLSLCVLSNLLPFLIFIKKNRIFPARGILMSTIILAIIITLNKLL